MGHSKRSHPWDAFRGELGGADSLGNGVPRSTAEDHSGESGALTMMDRQAEKVPGHRADLSGEYWLRRRARFIDQQQGSELPGIFN